jgi:hypothetical protein
MAGIFNCPKCGGENEYSGVGDTLRCQYCGSEIHPPADMVSRAAIMHLSSKAKIWIVLFVIVVFVLPTCIGFGGTLIGIAASVIGTLVGIFASFFGG